MSLIKTYTFNEITIDVHRYVDGRLQDQYGGFTDWFDRLMSFVLDLSEHLVDYDINPYPDLVQRGVYLLGRQDDTLQVFPNAQLILKCSRGHRFAPNLQKQFFRSLELMQQFRTQLDETERSFLEICPVYLHWQNNSKNAFFKQILFMPQIGKGVTLGQIPTGFSPEFCQTFTIPSLDKLAHQPQFALHRWLDPDPHRQLLKLQTTYLFRHLWTRKIKILSLNQKNILINSLSSPSPRYTIIDPTADFSLPVTPAYNLFTSPLCL